MRINDASFSSMSWRVATPTAPPNSNPPNEKNVTIIGIHNRSIVSHSDSSTYFLAYEKGKLE